MTRFIPQYITRGFTHWKIPPIFNLCSFLYDSDRLEWQFLGLMHQKYLGSELPLTAWESFQRFWHIDIAVHFYHTIHSYASTVLGVVILSVRPCVCHTRALWLIQRTYRQYFYTTWKGNPSSFLAPKISAKFQRSHPQRGRQIEVG